MPEGSDRMQLVIDPLIDGVTGAQSRATQSMEKRITDLVRSSYPRFERSPLPRTGEPQPGRSDRHLHRGQQCRRAGAPADAYRICLALADLKSRKIIAKGTARAKPEGIDVTPTAYFADAPVWTKDAATNSYVKNCQASRLGEAVDPVYLDRVQAAAYLAEAIAAYDGRKYGEALGLYNSAAKVPGGDQLRAYNGVYLTNWKLGRRNDASAAFAKVVDYSLNNNRLAVKFLFRPGTTQFFGARETTPPYAMWLSQIAERTAKSNACLTLVGHASPTGPEPLNDRLSKERAEALATRLKSQSPALAKRLSSTGVGFHENIVGTGRDDASDALDRRVEFKVGTCPTAAL